MNVPTMDQTIKSIFSMASGLVVPQSNTQTNSEDFISYDSLRIQKDKVQHIQMVMNRLVIVLNTASAIYVDSNKKH